MARNHLNIMSISVGPDDVGKGDQVWGLPGGEDACVLWREDRLGSEKIGGGSMVGECYVHGMTKGGGGRVDVHLMKISHVESREVQTENRESATTVRSER